GTPLESSIIEQMWTVQQTGGTAADLARAAGLLSVRAVDELTVVYELSEPLSTFPALLAAPALGMVFEPAATVEPQRFASAPVGTGPYVVIASDPDGDVAMVRFDQYWHDNESSAPASTYDELRFEVEPSPSLRLAGLAGGRFDLIAGDDLRVDDQSGLTVHTAVGSRSSVLVFDTNQAPFDDLRVRSGLAMAADRQAAAEALGGTPATQWFEPGAASFSAELAAAAQRDVGVGLGLIDQYVEDPNRSDARQPGEPIAVEVLCATDHPLGDQLSSVIAAWTDSPAVSVSVRRAEASDVEEAVVAASAGLDGSFGVACWWAGTLDEDVLDLQAFTGAPAASPANVADFYDQAIAQQLLDARSASGADLTALLTSVARSLSDNAVTIPVSHPVFTFAADSSVTGLGTVTTPEGAMMGGADAGALRWHSIAPRGV
ncbi:MAG: hypothetical protein KDB16_12230, partial [Acidimicrobiales bacterium]|nr:hypothetical protein [Acidimicrobiales bacterium]